MTSNSITTTTSNNNNTFYHLLRGPLIVAFVLFVFTFQYLIPYLSWKIVISAILLAVGSLLFVWDSTTFVVEKTRTRLRQTLDNIVLDDVLRTIFDPETGIWAVAMTTFFGNVFMYGLPLEEEQRVRLLRSCLEQPPAPDGDDFDAARTILLQRGGCRHLLPNYLQNWLESEVAKEQLSEEEETPLSPETTTTTATTPIVENFHQENISALGLERNDYPPVDDVMMNNFHHGTTPDSQSHDSSEDTSVEVTTELHNEEKRSTVRRTTTMAHQQQNTTTTNTPTTTRRRSTAQRPLPSASVALTPPSSSTTPSPWPIEVFGSIIKEMLLKSTKNVLKKLPKGPCVEATAMTTFVLLSLQLKHSKRAREMCLFLMQGAITLGLSGVLCGTLATAAATRLGLEQQLKTPTSLLQQSNTAAPQQSTLLSSSKTALTKRFFTDLLRRVRQLLPRAQWQGLIAAAVLYYFGQRRRKIGK